MKHRPVFFLLAVLCFLFLLLGNSQLAVTDPVESNYALTAKEMVLSGDWISPQIYGTYWFDKPIFIYWMLCISYTLCGFTDFASRLPGALFGTASVVLAAWYMLRRTGRMTAALIVAAMTVTSLAVWAISHSIITDQMLFFFTSAAMFFAYIGLTEGKKWYVVAAYVMAGFAVLTKGPVGIVLPGTFLLVFIALRRNTQYIKRLFPPVGIVLFLLVVLSWYGTMYARHGAAFIDGFLGFNNVVRATVSEHPEMNVWYYYVVLVPVSLLPWTGPCLYGLWKRRGWTDEYVFMTVWAVGTILFYTAMATKYPTYAYLVPRRIGRHGSPGKELVQTLDNRHWPGYLLLAPVFRGSPVRQARRCRPGRPVLADRLHSLGHGNPRLLPMAEGPADDSHRHHSRHHGHIRTSDLPGIDALLRIPLVVGPHRSLVEVPRPDIFLRGISHVLRLLHGQARCLDRAGQFRRKRPPETGRISSRRKKNAASWISCSAAKP